MRISAAGNLPFGQGCGSSDPHGGNTYFSIRLSRREPAKGDEAMQHLNVCFGVIRTAELAREETRELAIARCVVE
jgi:hypothetical protein